MFKTEKIYHDNVNLYSGTSVPSYTFTMDKSKVKLRTHHDITHLHPLTNVPNKYQLLTRYGCHNIVKTKF